MFECACFSVYREEGPGWLLSPWTISTRGVRWFQIPPVVYALCSVYTNSASIWLPVPCCCQENVTKMGRESWEKERAEEGYFSGVWRQQHTAHLWRWFTGDQLWMSGANWIGCSNKFTGFYFFGKRMTMEFTLLHHSPQPHHLTILDFVFPSFPFCSISPGSRCGAERVLLVPTDKRQAFTMPVTSFHLHVPERPNWYSKPELELHLRLTLVISEPHRAVCIIISDLDCVLPLCPSLEVERCLQKATVIADPSSN